MNLTRRPNNWAQKVYAGRSCARRHRPAQADPTRGSSTPSITTGGTPALEHDLPGLQELLDLA